ncbi:MAG: hypothetical protein ETSY2_43805 [Candidatus Entotheonella gemina]|uniref:Uncharacterized protein n=1 Tax=Candidatus Entotheonella gemina TaxID=1429439 RepID=W4LIW7_9BACT|nr:MAG: hypothetical protein ETSY2_43805 [Candidatus Entotheonella gemina]
MNIPDYRACDLPMRDDRSESHWQAWKEICSPGAQFTAEERSAMVRETAGINRFHERKALV